MKLFALITFVLITITNTCCAITRGSDKAIEEIFNLVKRHNQDLDDLRVVNLDQYDDWERNVIKKQKYTFIEKLDLNQNSINELFVSAYSPRNNTTHLIIVEYETKNTPMRLLKITSFSYPQLCLDRSIDGTELRAISVLGTESFGDVIWDGSSFNFVPFKADY